MVSTTMRAASLALARKNPDIRFERRRSLLDLGDTDRQLAEFCPVTKHRLLRKAELRAAGQPDRAPTVAIGPLRRNETVACEPEPPGHGRARVLQTCLVARDARARQRRVDRRAEHAER